MPYDFMCDRITENSPIRFLDHDVVALINKYRQPCPYVLKKIITDGMWKLRENEYISWKRFEELCRDYETFCLYTKFGNRSYYGNSSRTNKYCPDLISTNDIPTIDLYIGDDGEGDGVITIPVGIDNVVSFGGTGEGSGNLMRKKCETNMADLNRKMNGNKYPLKGKNNYGDGTYRKDFRMFKEDHTKSTYHKKKLKTTPEVNRKEKFLKSTGMSDYRTDREKYSSPLKPNVFNCKVNIVKHITDTYELNDKQTKKLNRKFKADDLVKLYWKGIIIEML